MKEQIIVKVERSTNNAQKPFITLYEKIVDTDTSVTVPYQNLVDTLRFLYGGNIVISVSNCIY